MAVVIESLFPEFGNQGGDNGNMMYLKASLPDAEFVETSFSDEPAFATRDVSFVYMGYMTEAEQEKVAAKLKPYRARLEQLVEQGCVMLFTGSAAELLGTSITLANGRVIEGLGLFDFTVTQDLSERIAEVFLGSFEPAGAADPIDIVGYKIQFTQAQGDNAEEGFCTAKVGFGLNRRSRIEGFHRGNLFATWLCGPLLPLNPLFTEYLMTLVTGEQGRSAAFREEALAAYRKRVEEFKTPGIKMPI